MEKLINDLDNKISKAQNITGNLFNDLKEIRNSFNNLKEAINYTHSCTELQAIEELKDFAYNNCQLHNTDQLEEIIERL